MVESAFASAALLSAVGGSSGGVGLKTVASGLPLISTGASEIVDKMTYDSANCFDPSTTAMSQPWILILLERTLEYKEDLGRHLKTIQNPVDDRQTTTAPELKAS